MRSQLNLLCFSNNVIILLVAHPTKMRKDNGLYNSPTLYDASGSSDFRNQTHDGF
jgi:twinkle protein